MRISTCLALVATLGLTAPDASAQSRHFPVGGARDSGVQVDESARADMIVLGANVASRGGGFAEGFDDITTLENAGWSLQNVSEPVGTTTWFQGNADAVFPSFDGEPTAYIGANFNSTAGTGVINTWLLTPELDLENGTEISFYSRVPDDSNFPDRLELRLSTDGSSTDVGTVEGGLGSFETLLLTINENLEVGGYPEVWTQYTATVDGLAAPTTGRVAFRYFVTSGGPTGANSSYIGIDAVSVGLAVSNESAAQSRQGSLSVAPNPSANSSVVRLDVANSQRVSVGLYDVTGRLVASLHEGEVAAGSSLSLRMESGLPTGVYVVRAMGEDLSLSQMVTIVR